MKADDDKLIKDILTLIGEHTDNHKKTLKCLRLTFNRKDLKTITGISIEWQYPKT